MALRTGSLTHSYYRFGESLPKDPPTTLPLSPVPSRSLSLRRVMIINDLVSYRKLSQTLPSAELSYLRSRVRGGEVGVLEQLFYAGGPPADSQRRAMGLRDNGVGYTWACITTTWWEKGGAPYGIVPGQGRTHSKGGAGKGLPLEVGVAVVRCANLRAVVSSYASARDVVTDPDRTYGRRYPKKIIVKITTLPKNGSTRCVLSDRAA